MSPERVAAVVARWVRLYSAGLPRPVAHRRIDEILADLHEQTTHERSRGVTEPRIARRLASRMLRGAAADVAWRAHTTRNARRHATEAPTIKEHSMGTTTFATSAVRVGAFVLAILAIPLVGTAVSSEFDWSVADFVLAGILLGIIGICIDAAIRRRGNLLIAVLVAGLGLAAGVAGELDDAPGLVLLGAMLIAGGAAVAQRRLPSTR